MTIYHLVLTVAIVSATMSYGSQIPELRGTTLGGERRNNHGRNLLFLNVDKYTQPEDFALGDAVNVNFDEESNQLQLDSTSRPFDFIWVAASTRGTIIKIDTNSGDILGEYRSTPLNHGGGNPSRTTVDRDGSVWLTNRADVYDGYGSIVHIGLLENNQCEDRNGNGIIETSTGLGDIKSWTNNSGIRGVATAFDECIVHYVKVNSTGTRHVSVTSSNDIWVSGYGIRNFDLIKGGKYDVVDSGSIIQTELSIGYGGYGGLIDSKGVIWSSGKNDLLRWDTTNSLTGDNGDPDVGGPSIGPPLSGTNWTGQGGDSYGLCVDSIGNVWNTHLSGGVIDKFSANGTFLGQFEHGAYSAQGCVVGPNDHVYIAHSINFGTNTIGHIKNDGTLVGVIVLEGTDGHGPGNGPSGVAVDRNGKIWATNYYSSTVSRIDPTLGDRAPDGTPIGKVDKTVNLGAGADPYNYSDMTGRNLNQAPTSGVWVVTYTGSDWKSLVWNAEIPNGTVLTIRARSSTNEANWTAWETARNGRQLDLAPGGYLQIQVSFERPSDTIVGPVLYELSVSKGRITSLLLRIQYFLSGVLR